MLPALKSTIKRRLPFVARMWREMRRLPIAGSSAEDVFSRIYRTNYWGDASSASGTGSNLEQTRVVRHHLPLLVQDLGCQSLLDIPCGDLYWMKLIELHADYIGGDIVEELVVQNERQFGGPHRRFQQLDLTRDVLPQVDLIFCRDCLVHLSYEHICQALENIRHSGSTYLLTTTFTDRPTNQNITTGDWRPLNLQAAPFRFPEPLRLINEECPQQGFGDKCLGLWQVNQLPACDDAA